MGMVGILTSNGFSLTGAATAYVGVSAGRGEVWNTSEIRVRQVMPVAGMFDYLRVKTVDPGGSGQSRAFTLRKAGSDTALTCTVNTGSTLAADTTHTVSVAAGDLVSLKQVASATAAASSPISWVARFTAANTNEFPLLWGASTGAGAGTTRYSPIQGDAAVQTTEAFAQSVIPTPGTLSNLYVALDANQATSGQTVTLFLNGVATGLTCTVSSGAATANDTTHNVAVVAGDLVSLEWNNAGSNAPRPRSGIKFAPTTDGESLVTAPAIGTQNAFVTSYQSIGAGSGVSVTEGPVQSLALVSDIKKLYTVVSGLGSGDVFTTTVRRNTADSTVTCAITGTATTGSDTTHTTTAADDDVIDFKWSNGAASGTFRPRSSFVLYIAPTAGPITSTPSTLALALTTFAPTVSATGAQTATPSVVALNLTAFAPTVSVSSSSGGRNPFFSPLISGIC